MDASHCIVCCRIIAAESGRAEIRESILRTKEFISSRLCGAVDSDDHDDAVRTLCAAQSRNQVGIQDSHFYRLFSSTFALRARELRGTVVRSQGHEGCPRPAQPSRQTVGNRNTLRRSRCPPPQRSSVHSHPRTLPPLPRRIGSAFPSVSSSDDLEDFPPTAAARPDPFRRLRSSLRTITISRRRRSRKDQVREDTDFRILFDNSNGLEVLGMEVGMARRRLGVGVVDLGDRV